MNKYDMYVYIVPLVVVALMGGQLAHATNESDYMYGHAMGKTEWKDCQIFNADCGTAATDCQSPTANVVNVTACVDGYIHAWNHICDPVVAKKNSLDCPITPGTNKLSSKFGDMILVSGSYT